MLDVDVVQGGGVRSVGLKRWLQDVAPGSACGSVTVALVSDARVRALNREYRKTDGPTDVLSFAKVGEHLGDIVIATGVARRQALAAGHSLQTELRILALHGLLHLRAMTTSETTAKWRASSAAFAARA